MTVTTEQLTKTLKALALLTGGALSEQGDPEICEAWHDYDRLYLCGTNGVTIALIELDLVHWEPTAVPDSFCRGPFKPLKAAQAVAKHSEEIPITVGKPLGMRAMVNRMRNPSDARAPSKTSKESQRNYDANFGISIVELCRISTAMRMFVEAFLPRHTKDTLASFSPALAFAPPGEVLDDDGKPLPEFYFSRVTIRSHKMRVWSAPVMLCN